MDFKDNLRAARKAKGLTIVQCANALGITNPAWNQWETGKREPKLSALIGICNLLDTTPNELLGVSSQNDQTIVSAGNGSAVAIGGNASASVVNGAPSTPGDSAACKKCPYRKKLEKLEKLLAK